MSKRMKIGLPIVAILALSVLESGCGKGRKSRPVVLENPACGNSSSPPSTTEAYTDSTPISSECCEILPDGGMKLIGRAPEHCPALIPGNGAIESSLAAGAEANSALLKAVEQLERLLSGSAPAAALMAPVPPAPSGTPTGG